MLQLLPQIQRRNRALILDLLPTAVSRHGYKLLGRFFSSSMDGESENDCGRCRLGFQGRICFGFEINESSRLSLNGSTTLPCQPSIIPVRLMADTVFFLPGALSMHSVYFKHIMKQTFSPTSLPRKYHGSAAFKHSSC